MYVYRAYTGQHGCVHSITGQHVCVQSMYRAAWMCTEHGWPLPVLDLPSSRLSQTEPLDKVYGIDLRKSTPPYTFRRRCRFSKTARHDKLILLGDFNARVGIDLSAWERVIRHHVVGNENSNGSLLLTMCAEFQLVITNTLFQQAEKKHHGCTHSQNIDI